MLSAIPVSDLVPGLICSVQLDVASVCLREIKTRPGVTNLFLRLWEQCPENETQKSAVRLELMHADIVHTSQ